MDKPKNYQAEGKKTDKKRTQVYMILFTKKILENAN